MYVYSSFCSAAGGGAVTGYDGYQCTCDMGTLGVVGKTDAEEEMARFPWRIEQYEYRTDSHGAGRWRGAPGVVWQAVDEGDDCKLMCGSWSGFTTQAKGQHGGGDTPLNRATVQRGAETIEITEPHRDMQTQDRRPRDHPDGRRSRGGPAAGPRPRGGARRRHRRAGLGGYGPRRVPGGRSTHGPCEVDRAATGRLRK